VVDYLYGIVDMSFWGYVLVTFIMVELTILGVTLYLHRDQCHRGLELHPAVRHFFRFWNYLTTGMGTRDWVSVHRKHHALCETEQDPHSPKILGLRKVLLQGAELYKAEAAKPETLEKYGRGCPDDWLERNVYGRLTFGGITALVIAELVLFGVPGIIMIAVQMMAIPFLAAGIINGVGHHSGYRNFECDDAATNIVPWGVLLGGEELHNNHHAFPSSAKFSARRWEFDIGWAVIRVLEFFGLARVKRVLPRPAVSETPRNIDLETARAVIVNRMHVLRDYTRKVTLPVFRMERMSAGTSNLMRRARKLLVRQPGLLDEPARARLRELLEASHPLKTVYDFRESLRALWAGRHVSNDRLLADLRDWCARAEASGIQALEDFALRLRGYTMVPVSA
jgi:stearoyl-CoA desaturase (delta-9 desaturase)